MKHLTLYTTVLLVFVSSSAARAAEIDGFTEPSRDLDLAAADAGRIETIDVEEGQTVRAGQPLASLNQDVLQASRRIVDKQLAAQGKTKSAAADLRLKTERVRKLTALLARNHAAQEEVDRADIEREIAAAAVEIVDEERAIRSLEGERIDQQIERQIVRSPIDGLVVKTFKDVGEFVSPADPVVVRVVQLDPLLATFNVPEQIVASGLAPGATAKVYVGAGRVEANAVVEFVSPIIEPQSGTVRVKVRLDNADGSLRAGEKCVLVIDAADRIAAE